MLSDSDIMPKDQICNGDNGSDFYFQNLREIPVPYQKTCPEQLRCVLIPCLYAQLSSC